MYIYKAQRSNYQTIYIFPHLLMMRTIGTKRGYKRQRLCRIKIQTVKVLENCTWMLMYSKIYYFLSAKSTLDKKGLEEITCTCI